MWKFPTTHTLNDLDFNLSMTLKIKFEGAGTLPKPTYDILSMFNSKMWHNSALLQDTSLRNLSDPESGLSRSNLMMLLYSPHMISY